MLCSWLITVYIAPKLSKALEKQAGWHEILPFIKAERVWVLIFFDCDGIRIALSQEVPVFESKFQDSFGSAG